MTRGRDYLSTCAAFVQAQAYSPFAADILGTGILPIATDAQARAGST